MKPNQFAIVITPELAELGQQADQNRTLCCPVARAVRAQIAGMDNAISLENAIYEGAIIYHSPDHASVTSWFDHHVADFSWAAFIRTGLATVLVYHRVVDNAPLA